MSDFNDYIKERVLDKTPHSYPQTKAEIVEYYQDRYPGQGKGGWKQHLIHDLLPFTPQTGKNPAKNLAKRFEKRLDTPEPRNAAQYKALGETLEPNVDIPENGYEITFVGEIMISEQCWPREFSVTISGDEAEALARTGNEGILFHQYWEGANPAEGVCGHPQIYVEALV